LDLVFGLTMHEIIGINIVHQGRDGSPFSMVLLGGGGGGGVSLMHVSDGSRYGGGT
jgi:hypothetical protein